jgi:hypothetical protein
MRCVRGRGGFFLSLSLFFCLFCLFMPSDPFSYLLINRSFSRTEGLGYREGLRSLWSQDKPLLLPPHSVFLPRRRMAKLNRYPWWQPPSQGNLRCFRLHSSGERTKSHSTGRGDSSALRGAISDQLSSYLHWESIKKVGTQQSAWSKINFKDTANSSYRSRWQLLP